MGDSTEFFEVDSSASKAGRASGVETGTEEDSSVIVPPDSYSARRTQTLTRSLEAKHLSPSLASDEQYKTWLNNSQEGVCEESVNGSTVATATWVDAPSIPLTCFRTMLRKKVSCTR